MTAVRDFFGTRKVPKDHIRFYTGLKGVATIADDLTVYGEDDEDVHEVLQRLCEKG